MTALRRLLLHSKGDVPSTSQLGDTNIGHFCLQSLTSSLRELRLAAAYNLGCFIGFGVTSVRESENQELIFHHMLLLSKQRTAAADETIIFSLRSLAYRSHDSSFLNTLLLKLVEFFYSSNAYIHGLAFDAVQSIAVGRRCTPTELLEPYWRTISVTAVQNLASRPQSVQMLCEVLEMSVNQFLVQTQLFTLPYLVLGGRREIVSRIASAHGADCSTFSLCTLPSNQAAVLAILLLQPFDDYEKSIMALLSAINPGFKKAELAELIRGTPDLIAVELLRFAGFTGKEMHAKVDKAFDVLGSFFSKTSSSASSMAKRVGTVAAFFDMHILAILTSLSFTLGDVTTNNTASEKLMSVLAIAALVRVAHSAVGKALPQVRQQLSLRRRTRC